MKKALLRSVVAVSTLALILPGVGWAQTVDQAQIQAMLQQIQVLQAQLQALQQQVSQQAQTPIVQVPVKEAVEAPTPLPTSPGVAVPSVQQNIPAFNRDLYLGLRNNPDVIDLQEFLTDQGYYAGPITGNYFLLTVQAVKKFQSAHGISPTGYFGPKTRAVASEILAKLIGVICPQEEGCGDNIWLPPQQLQITTSDSLRGRVGDYFKATFRVTGGSGVYGTEVSGEVPPGLYTTRNYCPPIVSGVPSGGVACDEATTLDSVTLYGTPSKSGVFTIIIYAADRFGCKEDVTGGTSTCPVAASYGKAMFTIVIESGTVSTRPPVIYGVKGPTALKVGEEGTWVINASDPSGGSLSYSVQWGDEMMYLDKQAQAMPLIPFRQTTTFVHTYYSQGVFTPVFRVANSQGQEAKTSISVQVGDAGTYMRPVYGAEPGGTLVRGQGYNFYGKVTGGMPNSRVYFFLQRPDRTMKYDQSSDILAKTNNYTDANGNFSLQAYQVIANEGQNGTYASWVSVGGVESNRLYHNVVSATQPPPLPADSISVSVITNKSIYTPDEKIQITIKAQNNSSVTQTLNFGSSCQTNYAVAYYDSVQNTMCATVLTSVSIPAYDSYKWTLVHSPEVYRVPEGSYKLTGRVIGYGEAITSITVSSGPVVVP